MKFLVRFFIDFSQLVTFSLIFFSYTLKNAGLKTTQVGLSMDKPSDCSPFDYYWCL